MFYPFQEGFTRFGLAQARYSFQFLPGLLLKFYQPFVARAQLLDLVVQRILLKVQALFPFDNPLQLRVDQAFAFRQPPL